MNCMLQLQEHKWTLIFFDLLLTPKEVKSLELCLKELCSLSYHFIYIINRLWELIYANHIFFKWKGRGKSSALQSSCSSRFHHSQLSACIHYQLVSQLYVPEYSRIHKQFSQLFNWLLNGKHLCEMQEFSQS